MREAPLSLLTSFQPGRSLHANRHVPNRVSGRKGGQVGFANGLVLRVIGKEFHPFPKAGSLTAERERNALLVHPGHRKNTGYVLGQADLFTFGHRPAGFRAVVSGSAHGKHAPKGHMLECVAKKSPDLPKVTPDDHVAHGDKIGPVGQQVFHAAQVETTLEKQEAGIGRDGSLPTFGGRSARNDPGARTTM